MVLKLLCSSLFTICCVFCSVLNLYYCRLNERDILSRADTDRTCATAVNRDSWDVKPTSIILRSACKYLISLYFKRNFCKRAFKYSFLLQTVACYKTLRQLQKMPT